MRFKSGDRVLLLPGKYVTWCGRIRPDEAWLQGTILGDHYRERGILFWGVQFDGRPHESDVNDRRLIPLRPPAIEREACTASDAAVKHTI